MVDYAGKVWGLNSLKVASPDEDSILYRKCGFHFTGTTGPLNHTYLMEQDISGLNLRIQDFFSAEKANKKEPAPLAVILYLVFASIGLLVCIGLIIYCNI